MLTEIKLSNLDKYKKFQLAALAGLIVHEIESQRRCYIVGADNYIDNDFKSIDDVLLLFRDRLYSKGFSVAA